EDAVTTLSDEENRPARAPAADYTWSAHALIPRCRLLVRPMSAEPAWVKPTVERLRHLLQLREDWDSYGAAPVDLRAARTALQLLAMIMRPDTPAPTVVPTVRGGLQLEW